MDSQNLSSSQKTIQKSPADISPATRSLPPQIFSKTPTILSSLHIPRKSAKQQPKHIRKLKVSPPTGQSFWQIIDEVQARTKDIERLKKTAKIMQKTKILANLTLSLKTITTFDLTYGLSRFQDFQRISTLDLKITGADHLTPSNIEILYHALASLKNLTQFSMELPELPETSFELIDAIGFPLRRLPSLSHLSLKFNCLWGFGDSHVKRFALHIKKLSKLKSLVLNFDRSTEITNIGLQPLSETLKKLPLLSDFSIHLRNFQGCSVSTFNDLFSSLGGTCKDLKKLDFSGAPGSDCDLKSIEPISLGLSLLNAPSLREITLKLYKDFSDYGMARLSQALTRFSSLKILSIEFPHDLSVSNAGLSQLSSALQTMTSLSTLTLLSLHSCQASQIQSLPPQSPEFGLLRTSYFPQSDELSRPIDLISQGIAPLKQLENLHLDLTACFGEKSTTIQNFSSSLQNLKSLKELKIKLSVCRFMEDKDITVLTQGLEMLQDLAHLEIDVRHIQTLTNQAVITLISSFSKLPKLDHLSLKLGTNKTDDNVPKIIAQGLKNLIALSSVELDFSHVDESSYTESVGVLCDYLKNSVSLRKIALELKATNPLREKIKELQKAKPVTIAWR